MKMKLLGIAFVIGLTAILFASCERRRELGDGNKAKGKAGILLWSDIDQGKWARIRDEVLKKDPPLTPGASKRTKLFRLRKYDPHPADEENGELDEAMLVYDIADLDRQAERDGFKGHAIQIGLGSIEDFQEIDSRKKGSPTPTPAPLPDGGAKMPQAHFRQNILESRKMVQEINAILNSKTEASPH